MESVTISKMWDMNSISTWLTAWEDELAQLPLNFKSAPPSSYLKYRYSFMEMKNI